VTDNVCACLSVSGKLLVVRGSPVHYLLVRANNYDGRVALVDNIDEAVTQLQSAAAAAASPADDDAVLLTDAAVADHVANHVCHRCRLYPD